MASKSYVCLKLYVQKIGIFFHGAQAQDFYNSTEYVKNNFSTSLSTFKIKFHYKNRKFLDSLGMYGTY